MAQKPTYQIVDWDRVFENAASRKVTKPSWVAIPNRHDSAGYARLISRRNGPSIYGAWMLLVQVASKMPIRGVLANESGPLDCDDLEARTRVSAKLFKETIAVLSDSKIGWISTLSSSVLPDCASALAQNRRERERTEEKGTELGDATTLPSPSSGLPDLFRAKPSPDKPPRHPRQPDPLWDALTEVFFPSGVSRSDGARIGRVAKELKSKNATPSEVTKRIAAYPKVMPEGCLLTLEALAKHWDALGNGAAIQKPTFIPNVPFENQPEKVREQYALWKAGQSA